MRVLSFDQSLSVTGWACGHTGALRDFDFGSIRIPKRDVIGERLAFLHGSVAKLVEKYHPDLIAFEEPFLPVGQAYQAAAVGPAMRSFLPNEIAQPAPSRGAAFSPETIKALQKAAGCIETLAALYSLPCESYAPASWRKTVLGIARAPKGTPADHMKKMAVQRMKALGYECNTDEAEALGVLWHALCGPQAAARAQGNLLAMARGAL